MIPITATVTHISITNLHITLDSIIVHQLAVKTVEQVVPEHTFSPKKSVNELKAN
jgi:hypothetical protein